MNRSLRSASKSEASPSPSNKKRTPPSSKKKRRSPSVQKNTLLNYFQKVPNSPLDSPPDEIENQDDFSESSKNTQDVEVQMGDVQKKVSSPEKVDSPSKHEDFVVCKQKT